MTLKKEEGIVVLSLFDGMSCGQIALKKLGVKVKTYYASEIDKYGQIVSKVNFPDTVYLGDVRNIDGTKLGKIDLIIGGSPCQSFSFAGKMKGMVTKENMEILSLEHYLKLKQNGFEFEGQSYLFWEFMRLKKETMATYFLLENVEMTEKWETILSRAIGINPIGINSALLSAQNRKRLYWTNIYCFADGLFGDMVCKIPKPKDKGILLKDILEINVDQKYFISQKLVDKILRKNDPEYLQLDSNVNFMSVNDKARTQRASTGGAVNLNKKHNFQIINLDGKPKKNQDKASCFMAGANSGGNHSDMDLILHNNEQSNLLQICVAMRGRNPDNPKSRESGLETEQMIEARNDGKTNCLTTVGKDNLVMQINPSKESGGTQPYQQNRIYDSEGISPALMANKSDLLITQNKSETIRRLTPLECARLQTVPDNYFWRVDGKQYVSDSQIYKMLGNGWTVDVIAYIFSFLFK